MTGSKEPSFVITSPAPVRPWCRSYREGIGPHKNKRRTNCRRDHEAPLPKLGVPASAAFASIMLVLSGRRLVGRLFLPRAGGAAFHPSLDQRAGDLLRAGRGLAAVARRPGPADQRVLADMMD